MGEYNTPENQSITQFYGLINHHREQMIEDNNNDNALFYDTFLDYLKEENSKESPKHNKDYNKKITQAQIKQGKSVSNKLQSSSSYFILKPHCIDKITPITPITRHDNKGSKMHRLDMTEDIKVMKISKSNKNLSLNYFNTHYNHNSINNSNSSPKHNNSRVFKQASPKTSDHNIYHHYIKQTNSNKDKMKPKMSDHLGSFKNLLRLSPINELSKNSNGNLVLE